MNKNHGLRGFGRWLIIAEKSRYLFRRYPASCGESLLFVGCNFPSLFPRATRELSRLAAERSLGTAFDCCGKPLDMMGRKDDAKRIIAEIEAYLDRLAVRELVTVCPNCYAYLKPLLSRPVVSIYEKLQQWGYQTEAAAPEGSLFLPCPDRKNGLLQQHIACLLPLVGLAPLTRVGCCGLGNGCPPPTKRVKEQIKGTLYTYCASCAGQWRRQGIKQTRHLLPHILGIDEPPDTAHSLRNRWRFKK